MRARPPKWIPIRKKIKREAWVATGDGIQHLYADIVLKRIDVIVDDLSDLEIAVLCDLLQGPSANLKAHKRTVLDQLIAKRLVEPAKNEPAKFQLSGKAHHLLAERGVGISGG
jgi:hypothetical protein